MQNESYKAENTDELVWLRLNRLKSTRLCENLLRSKLEKEPNELITEDIIKAKAIGISSAIESAIGYWQTPSLSCNARILSRYYFLLQLTIAEQVSSIKTTDTLKEIQKHTENGHGLGIISNPAGEFPDNMYVFALNGGHFHSYAKSVGLDVKRIALEKRPKKFEDVTEPKKLISVLDLFSRIPELNKVIEEYTDKLPQSFHVGHSQSNMLRESEAIKDHIKLTGKFTTELPKGATKVSDVAFYTNQRSFTIEYLESLNLPFDSYENYTDVLGRDSYIIGKLTHPSDILWHQVIGTYSSSHATLTYALPVWSDQYNSIIANFTLLYALSIVVRYLPDLWFRINNGDINHMGSLIEYYISIIDHVLPLQMLERITEAKIAIHNPGSFFGEI